MRILIDADGCPVVRLTERLAQQYRLPLVLFCDTSHCLQSAYGEVRVIGAGRDAVDFALTTACRKGDIVVTQDYGVAAMVLGKGAYAIHQNGFYYTADTIDRLLMERHLAQKARRASSQHHLKGPARRTAQNDADFAAALERLIRQLAQQPTEP